MGVDNAWLRHFAQMFAERTEDASEFEEVLKSSGLKRVDLKESTREIDPLKEGQFIRLACDHLRDRAFATIAGLAFDTPRDIVWYISKYSQNLKEAIENASHYGALVDESIEYRLVESENHASLRMRIVNGELSRYHRRTEFLLFSTISLMRIVTNTQLHPLGVRYKHVVKSSASAMKKAAGCTISFGSEENEINLSLASLDLPIPSYDPALRNHLTDYGNNLLRMRAASSLGIRGKVEAQILNKLPGRILSAQEVASNLGLSARSLSRRLNEEGQSFRGIVKNIRCDLAKTYLKDGFGIGEVAFYLDFADQPAFSTAFKHWTGLTPREFQKQN